MWIGLLIALVLVMGVCLLWVRIRIFTVTKKKIHFYIIEIYLYGKVRVFRKAFFYRWKGKVHINFYQVTKRGYRPIRIKKRPKRKLSEAQKLQIRKIISRLKIRNLEWRIELGLDDAFDTSMACGIVSMLFNGGLAIGRGFTQIDRAEVNVLPCYNKMHLKIDILCIIEFKLVKMIISALKLWLGK